MTPQLNREHLPEWETMTRVYWKVGNQLCGSCVRTDDPVKAQQHETARIVCNGRTACLAVVS